MEEIKLSLFTDGKSLYIENPEIFTKILELVNKFSKAAGYKDNIQTSVAFLNINMNYQKQKARKQSHLKSHQKEYNAEEKT